MGWFWFGFVALSLGAISYLVGTVLEYSGKLSDALDEARMYKELAELECAARQRISDELKQARRLSKSADTAVRNKKPWN